MHRIVNLFTVVGRESSGPAVGKASFAPGLGTGVQHQGPVEERRSHLGLGQPLEEPGMGTVGTVAGSGTAGLDIAAGLGIVAGLGIAAGLGTGGTEPVEDTVAAGQPVVVIAIRYGWRFACSKKPVAKGTRQGQTGGCRDRGRSSSAC
jgi:hypothetical protein